jgi:hypothetical protein
VSGLVSMEDGAWFCLPTSVACLPTGPNNRILLGQFTTSGVLSFDLNVQAFLGGDQVMAGLIMYGMMGVMDSEL